MSGLNAIPLSILLIIPLLFFRSTIDFTLPLLLSINNNLNALFKEYLYIKKSFVSNNNRDLIYLFLFLF